MVSAVIDRALPLLQYQLDYDMSHAFKEHEVKHCDQIKRPRLGTAGRALGTKFAAQMRFYSIFL